MKNSFPISLSVCMASLALLAACSKENPSTNPPPANPPATTASGAPPAPAASAPAPAGGSAASSGGDDQQMLALANKSGCLACHSVDKKIVGPAWKDVASKYRGQSDAPAKLEQKVKSGGQGAWGSTPMPPNAQVSEDDIKKLVGWILTLK